MDRWKLTHNIAVSIIEKGFRSYTSVIPKISRDWDSYKSEPITKIEWRDSGGLSHTCEMYFHVKGSPYPYDIESHHCGDFTNAFSAIWDELQYENRKIG